jgi:hypothetical protein
MNPYTNKWNAFMDDASKSICLYKYYLKDGEPSDEFLWFHTREELKTLICVAVAALAKMELK